MIDQVFDLCVWLLVKLAERLGTSYEAVNVWIFVVIWPALTLALIGLAVYQRRRIRRLENLLGGRKT
jgi:MprA protease rhombosortase-interaction domain-containing protein